MQPGDVDSFEDRLRQRAQSRAHALDTVPTDAALKPRGRIANTPLATSTVSFLLGNVFALGALTCIVGGFSRFWWSTYQLGFFLAAWSAFHWGEFAVTAGWNKDKCSIDSFLLENGIQYHMAHGFAIFEYLITLYFRPTWKKHAYVSALGVILAVVGQMLRSAAMIHAGSSFSHIVALRKVDTHILVTDGVYRWFRHPSYAGFFYWALGTQLVLQNPITFIGFAIVLWRFFDHRIRAEEGYLIRFFGRDYIEYRKRVGTRIPFIP
ncbi:protein-s-isoprenylcysteine O-methyltransferase [Laetiporus sulphureus 93-53]|uniref:Protein-S-isoprenylcysteine O-methyltransferase n=1 Tax=Laetiporus sulphureus 93-53 TaxID=1314785 RepID=A0A165I2R2_9APHY|nr:protein-s-isoprenylcysteine O-methyltransferase [Laetiporus sulphureus 93-53]KZT12514.1 protein-s-isoprenylcysteine O-methyltransferase [Laetiporus sulphureus 93-53]